MTQIQQLLSFLVRHIFLGTEEIQQYFAAHWLHWAAALIVLFAGMWIIRALRHALHKVLVRTKLDETLRIFCMKTFQWTVWIILIVLVLDLLGFDTTGFIAGLGAMTFVLGFAAKDTLGNLAAGVMLLIHKPYKIGDDVEIGGIRGIVIDIDVSACLLAAPEGEKVMVPNGKIWGAPIKNFSQRGARM